MKHLLSTFILFYVFIIHCCSTTNDLFKSRLVVGVAPAGGNIAGLLLAQQLKSVGYDIYGFYDETVIAATTQHGDELFAGQNPYELVDIGERNSSALYFVLERPVVAASNAPLSFMIQNTPSITILYSASTRVMISATDDASLTLPHSIEIIPLPTSPIVLGIKEDLLDIVTQIYAKASKKYLSEVADVTIEDMVAAVSPNTLKDFVTYLTGEDPSSNILTRNSFSQGAKHAAAWIGKHYESFGLEVSYMPFREGYCENVIGIKKGQTEPEKLVIFGAHYDDRATSVNSPTQRAPGANDNGSGTGAGLQVAKIFHDFNATFDYTVIFVAFGGEEQGLYGSAAYVKQLVAEKAQVVAMVNADMIAYRTASNPPQLDFPSRYSTPALQDIVQAAVTKYVPSLKVGLTNACCSDHQSFYSAGFPAVGCIEGGGYTIDPQYHQEQDLVNRVGYDVNEQYKQITQSILATMAILAAIN